MKFQSIKNFDYPIKMYYYYKFFFFNWFLEVFIKYLMVVDFFFFYRNFNKYFNLFSLMEN